MGKYRVTGTITIQVELDVEHDSMTTQVEALKEGTEAIIDFYNVNVVGGYHDRDNCKVELDAVRIKKTEISKSEVKR